MAYVYFLIGVGAVAIIAWIGVAIYENSSSKQLKTE